MRKLFRPFDTTPRTTPPPQSSGSSFPKGMSFIDPSTRAGRPQYAAHDSATGLRACCDWIHWDLESSVSDDPVRLREDGSELNPKHHLGFQFAPTAVQVALYVCYARLRRLPLKSGVFVRGYVGGPARRALQSSSPDAREVGSMSLCGESLWSEAARQDQLLELEP